MAERIYILDTNVLLQDPEAIYSFPERRIGIPLITLEELDTCKAERSERGHNSRAFIRHLDELRHQGSLKEGIKLANGAIVQVLATPEKLPLKTPLKADVADNVILITALLLQQEGSDVYFVSNDINARVKADFIGLHTLDYQRELVDEKHFYTGWVEVEVPAVQLKKECPEELLELAAQKKLYVNQFVWLLSQHNRFNYRIFRYLGGDRFKPVEIPQFDGELEARNPQQLMALDLLLDPAIQLVSLVGPAGTGKTFLTLLAGLRQVLETQKYEKMLISRPVIPLGPDIGYLPGDLQEKLFSWMQPVYDNMELILHELSAHRHLELLRQENRRYEQKKTKKRRRFDYEQEPPLESLKPIDQLIRMGKVNLDAVTYMRGRSIPYQFIFIDEVQNLNPHEAKTLITRVGQGSKMIIAGDPFQIDSPYLDFTNNGLVVASEKFKGQALFGSVFLTTTERSELSRLASELL